ncbi:hypothetical protein, partial [Thiolapillus sp.]|uniref:hypothetical protein n=1 Tax=Thiolapillus sp. TaxID=2017437 RepID=UPI003AF69570
MTRTAGAPMGCQRPSRFWGLGCPKIYHEAEDTLARNSPRKRKLSKFRISAICHWTVESLTRKRPRGWRFSKSSG